MARGPGKIGQTLQFFMAVNGSLVERSIDITGQAVAQASPALAAAASDDQVSQ